MESREQHDGQEDRPGSGPIAELVEDHSPVIVYDPTEPLVNADYEDEQGRWWRVRVPAGSFGQEAMGIPVGPPDLSSLGLPDEVSIRLHNQLFQRGLFTKANLRGRGQEIFGALQAAYKVDASAVTAFYR